jgi:hypothetical protein
LLILLRRCILLGNEDLTPPVLATRTRVTGMTQKATRMLRVREKILVLNPGC